MSILITRPSPAEALVSRLRALGQVAGFSTD